MYIVNGMYKGTHCCILATKSSLKFVPFKTDGRMHTIPYEFGMN